MTDDTMVERMARAMFIAECEFMGTVPSGAAIWDSTPKNQAVKGYWRTIATALLPLVREAQAGALEGAADEFPVSLPLGMTERYWLRARAATYRNDPHTKGELT